MRIASLDRPDIARSLLNRIIYFDIFSYPLLPDEVINYCDFSGLAREDGTLMLEKLVNENLINYSSGFYFLGIDKSKIAQRLEDNNRAKLKLITAKRYARLIANFPYIRAVFISGTLSKNVMKPDSDIDFFIITKPGRLWLCRGLLTGFKKLILLNSHKNFCLNYFVDSESLEIPDKNLFTATEIAFILPMFNYDLYQKFLSANNWYKAYYPNMAIRKDLVKINPISLKKTFEFLFNTKLGEMFEKWSFLLITGYWKKKFNYFSAKSYSLNFRSLKNVSKHHPNAYQEKILERYSEKLEAFERFTGFRIREKVLDTKNEQ